MMPGWTQEEVSSFLRPIYGLEEGPVTSTNPFSVDFNVTDRNSNISRPKISDPNPKVELVERSEETLETFPSHMVTPETYEEVKPVGKRKRGRPRKTKHGYLNDDFIDDGDNDDIEWMASAACAEESGTSAKQKKRRGRPKKIKEEEIEELQHYDDEEEMEETVLEPVVKVKEEEVERSFHEFNEFFAATAAANPGVEDKISFNQDDSGQFHCEAPGCSFSTYVRASVQQHVRQTHSGEDRSAIFDPSVSQSRIRPLLELSPG